MTQIPPLHAQQQGLSSTSWAMDDEINKLYVPLLTTHEWFEKLGDNFQNEEEFQNTAPIIYAISQELKAIKRINKVEDLLNVSTT